MQTTRVNMADVAARAGVSVATVSKVVNGRYGVAPGTSARVQEVITELGYETSLVARSLRSSRTNVLGILVAEFEPFSTELLKGISAAVVPTGYELLAYSTGGGAQELGWERRSLSRLAGTLIDGAIIVTPTVVETHPGVPVVAVDPHTGPPGLPTVSSDNRGGALLATQHLLGLGHRRIAFLGGRADLQSARLREEGFRSAMAAAGVEVAEDLVREAGYAPGPAAQAARDLLAGPERPTAVFATNDTTAVRVVEVAAELGLDVPRDLSVVGFDDVPEAAAAHPPLTTVAQPLQDMGAEALRMLVDLVAGVERTPSIQLPTRLVVRSSTAPPRA